jgi:hypothetical protein
MDCEGLSEDRNSQELSLLKVIEFIDAEVRKHRAKAPFANQELDSPEEEQELGKGPNIELLTIEATRAVDNSFKQALSPPWSR